MSKVNRGENNPKAKLKEIDVIQILYNFKEYETTSSKEIKIFIEKMSNQYNVSKSIIKNIILNKSWKYLER